MSGKAYQRNVLDSNQTQGKEGKLSARQIPRNDLDINKPPKVTKERAGDEGGNVRPSRNETSLATVVAVEKPQLGSILRPFELQPSDPQLIRLLQ